MIGLLKRPAECVLAHGGPAHLLRSWNRTEVLVLAYHNIVPDGVTAPGERSLHLPRAIFARQLDRLAESHEIISLEEVIRVGISRSDRPRAVITFDDAYQGAVRYGLAETSRRGFPATVFVAPGYIGGGSFWWDVLAATVGGEIPGALRSELLEMLRGSERQIRAWAVREGWALQEPPHYARAATLDELHEAARLPGVSLGAHSWSHYNLTRLTGTELRDELERPLLWLRGRFENVIPWLSYPYGSTSPMVEEAAAALGYRGAVTIMAGWSSTPARHPLSVPRLNIPAGISPSGFTLQTSGLFRRG